MQDLEQIFQQMEKAADKLFDKEWLHHLSHIHWEPVVNIYDCNERIVFLLELPGIPRENVSIQLIRDTLIISGIKPDPRPRGAVRCLHMEIPQGRFRKQVKIGVPVRSREIKASMRAGTLEIVVPKETNW